VYIPAKTITFRCMSKANVIWVEAICRLGLGRVLGDIEDVSLMAWGLRSDDERILWHVPSTIDLSLVSDSYFDVREATHVLSAYAPP